MPSRKQKYYKFLISLILKVKDSEGLVSKGLSEKQQLNNASGIPVLSKSKQIGLERHRRRGHWRVEATRKLSFLVSGSYKM